MARKARRALFTDSESGKCSTISGSRIATFVPCWSRLAYLPRTAVGLAAVPEVSGFFIEFSLGWSSEPGADDTDNTVCFIMNPKQQTVFRGRADIDKAFVPAGRLSQIGITPARGL